MLDRNLNTAPLFGTLGKRRKHIKQKEFRGQQLDINNYDFTSSVTEMLQSLNWQTLHQRKINTSLILLYKISNNLVTVDHHHLVPIKKLNFHVPFSRTLYHQNSLFPRTIRIGIVSQVILRPVPIWSSSKMVWPQFNSKSYICFNLSFVVVF